MTGPGAGGAITDGKDVRVARGLQRREYHKLVVAVRFEPVERGQYIRGRLAGRPHNQCGRKESSVGEPRATRGNLLDARRRMHLDAEILQDFQGLVGESFRQRWQDALSCLDQVDCDVLSRV